MAYCTPHLPVDVTPAEMRPQASLTGWAESASRQLLTGIEGRLAHTLGVGRQARWVSRDLGLPGPDADLLEAAALLHDVGYAPALIRTGFHPIDGARYVFANTGNRALTCLVAHHSHARIEARLRGFTKAMDQFEEPDLTLADALAYCDMTVGPQGQPMSVDGRLADIHQRYEATHVVAQAVTEARPLLLAAVGRTEARVRAATASSQRRTA